MKKYNSIKEMEEDRIKQKNTWNKACIEAMTDEELRLIQSMVEHELLIREREDDEAWEKEMNRRMLALNK